MQSKAGGGKKGLLMDGDGPAKMYIAKAMMARRTLGYISKRWASQRLNEAFRKVIFESFVLGTGVKNWYFVDPIKEEESSLLSDKPSKDSVELWQPR